MLARTALEEVLSMPGPFIGLDWGTTTFRAYLVAADGTVSDRVSAQKGIMHVEEGDFETVLQSNIHHWDETLPVIATGMITSRQGWLEVPYVDCPAGPADLAKGIVSHKTAAGRMVHFIPGLHVRSRTIGHDVMRSEETEVLGEIESGAPYYVSPGTHSKWIDVVDGQIVDFSTYMTGETYAALKSHTILGRLMEGDANDDRAFANGVERSLADPAGWLHNLFSARSLALFEELSTTSVAAFLSGLLIGAEVAHAISVRKPGCLFKIIASERLAEKYSMALNVAGTNAELGRPLALIRGERTIAMAAGLI